MPPLAISKADLRRLVEITAESIGAAALGVPAAERTRSAPHPTAVAGGVSRRYWA